MPEGQIREDGDLQGVVVFHHAAVAVLEGLLHEADFKLGLMWELLAEGDVGAILVEGIKGYILAEVYEELVVDAEVVFVVSSLFSSTLWVISPRVAMTPVN